MKKLAYLIVLIILSCKENKNIPLAEKQINNLAVEIPTERFYIELIDYYPALDSAQSNFYIIKNIHNNDTMYVLNNLPIYDFIKNYKGIDNTTITLEKGNFRESKENYIVKIPTEYNIDHKKIYLGQLINLVD
ncbi:hypothetical protein [Chryseobacterium aureum]|uniref:hypothetical protein n=1 Tax=Chryseobacterium aureum TaxID=2497456 RepID=UPI000F88683F|nr:hypothetical protein [Chryseobacterium aureum]